MAEALEAKVGEALRKHGWTLALGESCTGGLLGHRITNVPSSSDYFVGGYIAYAYEAKEQLLGVRHNTLYKHGAVSQETVLEMARGARQMFNTDVGIAVTGISGPGGGTPDKPIGLTWVAASTRDDEWSESHIWEGDRQSNKAESATAALALLLRVLEGDG
jgi:PncC family amidohydrolase